MAENQGVWGIEIGQAGLKAIRLRYAEAAGQVIAVAFDYVPHPKLLSQPDAVPDELIAQALQTFLSRNDLKGDKVAISLPSQSALARFITLPPVESSKVAEIVRYEARQQIPFPLEEVIWDYQKLGGGIEESGFTLGAEVGLFAMKRDLVHKGLQPFLDARVEVELIQIAPLALYNFVCYDQLGMRPGEEFSAPEEHTLVLDVGADTTTMVVTNGEKIWIRSVPIGGNHFTRALTKGMKLTFAKAEHLKCNATKAPDPRAVFQTLRPVFNDFVSEMQRSIGYFQSVNREAKIGRVLGVGNGFKLAGLQKFLQQNLQFEVKKLDKLQSVVGDAVVGAPLFQDNLLTFAVPYGLALQTLELSGVSTTLLPPEIATARMIRRKKPWAVLTAAVLLFGLALSAMSYANVASTVGVERFAEAEKAVDSYGSKVSTYQSGFSSEESRHQSLTEEGANLVGTLETRAYWLELYRAINEVMPRDTRENLNEIPISHRKHVSLRAVSVKREADLATWWDGLKVVKDESRMNAIDMASPPSGEGFVVKLECVHYYHNEQDQVVGVQYALQSVVRPLAEMTLQQEGTPAPVPVRKLGITHAIITDSKEYPAVPYVKPGETVSPPANTPRLRGRNPRGLNSGQPRPADANAQPSEQIFPTTFTVEFAWKPTPEAERDAVAEAAEGETAVGDPAANPAVPTP